MLFEEACSSASSPSPPRGVVAPSTPELSHTSLARPRLQYGDETPSRTALRRGQRLATEKALLDRVEELQSQVVTLTRERDASLRLRVDAQRLGAREAAHRLHMAACAELQSDINWAPEAVVAAGWRNDRDVKDAILRGSVARHHGLYTVSDGELDALNASQLRQLQKEGPRVRDATSSLVTTCNGRVDGDANDIPGIVAAPPPI